MGKKNISIKDVAEFAGVSPATVSRVINNTDYPVKEETRKTVKKAVKELNYQPNQVARGLVKKKSNIIGIVVHDISSAYFSEILKGIEDIIFENNYIINIFDTRYSIKRQLKALNILQANQVEALIFPGGLIINEEYNKKTKRYIENMKENNCKIIGITKNPFSIDNIDIGNELATRTITEYLINKGHQKIAYVNGPDELNASRERLNGFRKALKIRGIKVNENLIVKGGFDFKSGRKVALKLLNYIDDFTAVVVANDESALGLIWEFQQRDIDIPEDISVVGIGNIPRSKYTYPPLTTVDLSLYKNGKKIGEHIIKDLTSDENIIEEYDISVGVVERDSVQEIN